MRQVATGGWGLQHTFGPPILLTAAVAPKNIARCSLHIVGYWLPRDIVCGKADMPEVVVLPSWGRPRRHVISRSSLTCRMPQAARFMPASGMAFRQANITSYKRRWQCRSNHAPREMRDAFQAAGRNIYCGNMCVHVSANCGAALPMLEIAAGDPTMLPAQTRNRRRSKRRLRKGVEQHVCLRALTRQWELRHGQTKLDGSVSSLFPVSARNTPLPVVELPADSCRT